MQPNPQFQGGSALYLATSKNTEIDGACTFENNIVDTRGDPKYDDDWVWGGGGGMLYVARRSTAREKF
jgi:hypothetical protein